MHWTAPSGSSLQFRPGDKLLEPSYQNSGKSGKLPEEKKQNNQQINMGSHVISKNCPLNLVVEGILTSGCPLHKETQV